MEETMRARGRVAVETARTILAEARVEAARTELAEARRALADLTANRVSQYPEAVAS